MESTHVELNAADGSLLIIETMVDDGALIVEVFRHKVSGTPLCRAEVFPED
jgi:hypothetical protein